MSFDEYMHSFHLGVELYVYVALVDMVKQFLKSCANLYSHQPCIRVPVASHLQQIDTVNLLNFSYFDRFVV